MKTFNHNTLRKIIASLLLAMILISCSATPAQRSGKQIVVLWHTFAGNERDTLQALTDAFNASNPWNLVLITEYQTDIVEKLAATEASHRPDLVVIWPEDLRGYRQHGLIEVPETSSADPLDSPRLPADVRRERDDLLPMARALYAVDGSVQALPLGLATYLFYYNVDWMGDLGYDVESATWEDLRRSACAATDPIGGQVGVGLAAQSSVLLAVLASGGANVFGEDNQYHFADTAGINTAVTLNEMLAGSCALVYSDLDVGISRLSHSSMSAIVESSKRLPEIDRAVIEGRNFPLGVSALPGPTGPGATLWYGPGLLLQAPEGQRREAALAVMGWFFSSEAQQMWSSRTDYLPVRRSLIEDQLDTTENVLETQLLNIALSAADQDTWVAWPRYTNYMTCRASLLRALLLLGQSDTLPGAYIDTAVTACNTGVPQ